MLQISSFILTCFNFVEQKLNWWTWLSRRYSENENYNDRGEEKRYPSPYQMEVSIMSRNILDELYDYDLFRLTEIEDMDGS